MSGPAKKESADKARAKRIGEIQKRIGIIDMETRRISKEVEQIKGPEKKRIAAVKTERMSTYTIYFSVVVNF